VNAGVSAGVRLPVSVRLYLHSVTASVALACHVGCVRVALWCRVPRFVGSRQSVLTCVYEPQVVDTLRQLFEWRVVYEIFMAVAFSSPRTLQKVLIFS
jgi:hypothetical protein